MHVMNPGRRIITGGQRLFQATVKSLEFILSTLGSHWRAKHIVM